MSPSNHTFGATSDPIQCAPACSRGALIIYFKNHVSFLISDGDDAIRMDIRRTRADLEGRGGACAVSDAGTLSSLDL